MTTLQHISTCSLGRKPPVIRLKYSSGLESSKGLCSREKLSKLSRDFYYDHIVVLNLKLSGKI